MTDQGSEGLFSSFLRKKPITAVKQYLCGDILDFGCGSGNLARFVSPDHYLGIDQDESSLQIARRTHPEHVFYDEIAKVDRTFDTITILAVIEHVADPVFLLKQLCTFLRASKESRIVCTTPTPALRSIHELGAKCGLFSLHASDEHEELLGQNRLAEVGQAASMCLTLYQRFLFGANQIAIFEASKSYSSQA